jgi:transmembrane 9 superfamily protein 2/4
LCVSDQIPKKHVEFINECIANEYALNWVVDGLPAAHVTSDERTNEEYYSIGFALGSNKNQLNNHYDIHISYHHREDGKNRVVGVLVYPSSRNQKLNEKDQPVSEGGPLILKGGESVLYTYSVKWEVRLVIYLFALGEFGN